MDETANQMSDVREELVDVMQRAYTDATNGSPFSGAIKYPIADAILARFELTARPVVTDAVLGEYVRCASTWSRCNADRGERFRSYLDEAGLRIVRTEDGHR